MREKLIAASRATYRVARRFAVTFGVIVAVIVVSTLTIDLGPALKARAEREGSNWLERKMTSAGSACTSGAAASSSRTCSIDGMFPNEPPWLVAKRIDVSLTWGALFDREVLLDTIEMTDWRMVVESFPDGRQTFPRADRSAAHAAHRPAPGRDDAAVRARASRRVRLQRLRIGLARRRAATSTSPSPRPATIAARCASPTARS